MKPYLTLLLGLCLATGFENVRNARRISSSSLQTSSTSIFLTESINTTNYQKTGITREIQWEAAAKPVPLRSEIRLLESGVLVRRGEFGNLYGERLDEVNEECQRLGMTLVQGLLIRRQLMVSKVVRSSWVLKNERKLAYIERTFERQEDSLLDMAKVFDLPPVSIIRGILTKRVYNAYPDLLDRDRKRIVKSIISGKSSQYIKEFLLDWEFRELQQAKENDVVGYTEETETPVLWEEALYAFLNEENINYVKEDELREAEMKITPDCLILDDCYINGQKVRWIDAKSFYASGLKENKHFTNSLKKQILRYETEFGESGAVMFKHGFSRQLRNKNPSTLFLDSGPLHTEFRGNQTLLQ